MALKVEIDGNSGFCGGVIRAIGRSEKFLNKNEGKELYSLGSIVHNEAELERLASKGLVAIGKDKLSSLSGSDVLIRAHGEPPQTYKLAEKYGINLIDCTCPVVLHIQKQIKQAYARLKSMGGTGQIVIFGKVGHAEVLGLVGQADGDALVVENIKMFRELLSEKKITLSGPIEIFSQTTKNPDEYDSICTELLNAMSLYNHMTCKEIQDNGILIIHNTICSQVASRYEQLSDFAASHDVIVFVSGKESSNGKILYELCAKINPRSHQIVSEEEIDSSWFHDNDFVGVCGATSTPKWLLEAVASKISVIAK